MRLVTACNQGYISRIQPYIQSLAAHVNISTALITVGFDYQHPDILTFKLPRSMNNGAPFETESPQHGSFLPVIDTEDNDVFIFTDGDIILQRPFTKRELDHIHTLPEGVVMAGYNSGPDETLAIEGARLFPRFSIDQIGAKFGLMDKPCYNIGVFIARRSTYQAIYDEYMTRWQMATDAFGHPARQQWLVVYTIHKLGLEVKLTPYSLHANGHYGMPPGCYYRDGVLYSGADVVALRHKL